MWINLLSGNLKGRKPFCMGMFAFLRRISIAVIIWSWGIRAWGQELLHYFPQTLRKKPGSLLKCWSLRTCPPTLLVLLWFLLYLLLSLLLLFKGTLYVPPHILQFLSFFFSPTSGNRYNLLFSFCIPVRSWDICLFNVRILGNSSYILARKTARINLSVIQIPSKTSAISCIKVYHLLSLLKYCT